ncbi:sugar kinase and transcription regulator [Leuconostoc kimchii IMSNU 11154]|uniref:Sugar kinase and transcription regulator n=1 Tax=Leuconostoc kimchii (strain IMSNU 11154 / KCTC 2386 / IH25) TaxID=762051 RepID=D5T273_LEUKI|nr:ROK family protein [Leuconostoc kimchii]ADG40372.1 sugar kinase and transcription regulator [Leuconostoc kimchii IMSNU 11154]
MNLNYLAIDIGGTNVKYGIVNRAGQLIERHSEPTQSENLTVFLAQLQHIINRYAKTIKGLGISVPGKVDHHDETIYGGGALTFLDKINLPKMLDIQVPVGIENDGKAAALAELWLGNLKGISNGAAIVLGTGVGGGLVLNGELFTGTHFQAGELSFLSYHSNMSFDHFEGSLGSAVKMIERVAVALNMPDKHDGLKVFEAINQRHEVAWPIFEAYVMEIGLLIYNVQTVVDLERCVIGGGISSQPIVTTEIEKAYHQLFERNTVVAQTLTKAEILPSHFSNDANLYGAIYNLLLKIDIKV